MDKMFLYLGLGLITAMIVPDIIKDYSALADHQTPPDPYTFTYDGRGGYAPQGNCYLVDRGDGIYVPKCYD